VLQSWPTVAERDFVVDEGFGAARADVVCVADADLGAVADPVVGGGWLPNGSVGTSTEQAGASKANNSAAGGRAVIAHPFSTASFSPVNMVLHVVEARSASS
jgi:hypothetical protein